MIVHCKREKYDVYIGRPGILGNPFTIGKDGTRDEVIEKFEAYARHRIARDEEFKAAIKMCHGQTLGCWCAPQRCHGDVIEKLALELRNGPKL